MRIAQLSLADIRGGAHRAGYRIHRALCDKDISSSFFVFFKDTDDYTVIGPETKLEQIKNFIRYGLDAYPSVIYKNKEKFSTAIIPSNIPQKVLRTEPDLIHLHWFNGGTLGIRQLRTFRRPLVWTLHDMWAFTGGCHYDNHCERYIDGCGCCPLITSRKNHDVSFRTLRRKEKYWENLNLTIVTPSKWLAHCAQKSPLFKNKTITTIPYAIDLDIYSPIDSQTARDILGLPSDKILILVGAMQINDQRKGVSYLLDALSLISEDKHDHNYELVIFGASTPPAPPDISIKINFMGFLKDEISMAIVYSAADLFIAPSVQDNLPNTVIEALSCGTPSLAFNIGGMPDMIIHKKNGYLAEPHSVESLAEGILWVTNSADRLNHLSKSSRDSAVDLFNPKTIADQYLSLYSQAMS